MNNHNDLQVVPDSGEVLIVLLPGMDGTGTLFNKFVGLLT